ncbi:MAG: formate dehydrogenase subunit alpha [Candidatus Thermoplasmatota archaeon]|nr:formate dehydrogenase subunit alpha [Candidatus Thermoplasmatota archaeon]
MISINGKEFQYEPGRTILDAARDAGIYIPTLCYHSCLPTQSACRLCLVEVEGARTLCASCSYPVRNGLKIQTDTFRVLRARRMILELILQSHKLNCVLCDKNGTCELQRIAYDMGIEDSRFGSRSRGDIYDDSSFSIVRELDQCVLCGRCVAACSEMMVNGAIGFTGRGSDSRVSTAFFEPLKDSSCVQCGACVAACPVTAIRDKRSERMGRSFEMKKTSVVCPYCGVGCTFELNSRDNKFIRVTMDEPSYVNGIMTCVKGKFGLDFINHPDRLTKPLIKENGTFREASWDEAYGLIAEKFLTIKKEYGSDALAGFSSSKCSNEENFLMQKLVRCVFGTNNVDNCARLCHASTVAGLKRAFGSGAMTNSIDEVEKSDVILVTGSNTTETHPVIGSLIKRAVRYGKTKLIVVDPRKIELVDYSDIWLRQRNGTDVAWLNGMMNVILSEGLADMDYIKERCTGFEEVAEIIKRYTPEYVEKISGIPADDLIEAARLYAKAGRSAIYYSMGITQHTTGTDNVLSIANLAMLTGNVGIEGGGVNPLRGQNNVQGACDMCALPNVLPGYQDLTNPELRGKFERAWGVTLPDKVGMGVVEILNAAARGDVRGLYVFAENPMISDPDTNHVREALGKLEYLVVQDIFLTETAQLADVVLPSTCFAEKDGTITNTERRVQRTNKALDPPGEARADWKILCEVAGACGYDMDYGHPSEIMDEIATLAPIYGGMSYDRLGEQGLQWPCTDKDHPGTKFLHKGKFSHGKGIFHNIEYKPPAEVPDEKYPFVLSTGRMLYHFHTGSMTRRSFTLDATVPEGYVELNPLDADRLGVKEGDYVNVRSRRGEIRTKAQVTDKVDVGSVFIPFHFAEAAANVLTNPVLDPIAKIPELKVCAVAVEKAE